MYAYVLLQTYCCYRYVNKAITITMHLMDTSNIISINAGIVELVNLFDHFNGIRYTGLVQ